MQQFELIAPCHFGLESVLKDEIYDLGYEISAVEDGRVTFTGDAEAIVRANIGLRSAERVLLKVGSFHAETYDELFEKTKALPWEKFLPRNAKFWVTKAATVKSRLFSPSDIQSIMKKAMVSRMSEHYHLVRFPEDGAEYPVRVFLKKDEVTAAIDTTGESLHKRGYRKAAVKAPIAENLAAGLLMLTPWKPGRILVDPFCGSGTFLIEAAMISAGIAPGMNRSFTAQSWTNLIPEELWDEIRQEAKEAVNLNIQTDLQGFDIDPDAVAAARENAKLVGVADLIHFQVRPVSALSHPKKYGFIITNPPYGERLTSGTRGGEKYPAGAHPSARPEDPLLRAKTQSELTELYHTLGERFRALDSWSMYLITSYADAERALGFSAAKNRKIYNGMIKTYFYMFPGPKPRGHKPQGQ
ncbi:MAG: class I SAM-dependent RNA methyltransferase [Firmicutes bacterium]|nr:class I SAM-dependent RNA methyltransferase [Bacillota bacterium]